jgi:predicted metal-dependent phosphoesterase TrpH
MMIFDLHAHTDASDGELPLAGLVDRAKMAGVNVLAVTDHDLTHNRQQLQTLSDDRITVIGGVEFSTFWRKIGVHVVGLNIDPRAASIAEGVTRQQGIRYERAGRIASSLEKLGVPAPLEGARKNATGSYIGRPHFARYLVECGYVASEAKAFKKYLGAGKIGDVKHLWPAMDLIIEWIKDAGGIAVLAHPLKYKLTRSKLHELCRDFKAAGGQAIEVVSGAQAAADTAWLSSICREANFLASCGSDFHRPDQSWASLGRFPAIPSNCTPVWDSW